MNIYTYIIGTGYLSDHLKKKINNSKVISANDFINDIETYNNSKNKFNLVINSFFPTKKLSYFDSYVIFTKKAILEVANLLDLLDPIKVNKIIYTSSSSIYGSLNNNINQIDDNNRKIYAGFKISVELLIKNYCNKKGISLHICRVFNLYGKDNEFSIIEKIKNANKNKNKIEIFNQGSSLRDFIHIDDVVKIYIKILKELSDSGVYDIGTGKGISVSEILNKLKFNKKYLIYKRKKINEIFDSIADNRSLLKKIKKIKFKKIEDYLKIKEQLDYKKISNKNYIENNLTGSIIYGAGFSGKKIAKQISSIENNKISYFVDDDPIKIGTLVNNVKVISFNELKILSRSVNIRNIIIAIPSLDLKRRTNFIRKVAPYCDSISTLPEKSFLNNNLIDITDINDISFDELFGKDTLKVEFPIVKKLKNTKILITGGAGSIGTEITKQIARAKPKEIIVLDHSELNIYRISNILKDFKAKLILGDIKDEVLVKNLIIKHKVDYIFHAAAYKHVKFLEENVHSAFKNNVIGTYNLLRSIKGKKINFVFISTDKAVNPKNILGVTKKIGEILTQIIFSKKEYKNSNFFILRFGNVIGSDGSALPFFLKQIKNDETIYLTHKNMSRFFMSIKEACNLVLQSSVSNYTNKTLFLDMGKPIRILDIIKRMFKEYSKKDQKLKIKISGNKYNEKLSEVLSYKQKIYKTSINKVLSVQDKLINKNKFIENLDNIILNLNLFNENDLKKTLYKLTKIK